MVGNIIVLVVVAALAGLAARSIWKEHKAGTGCGGDCAHCGGCHRKENQ